MRQERKRKLQLITLYFFEQNNTNYLSYSGCRFRVDPHCTSWFSDVRLCPGLKISTHWTLFTDVNTAV